MKSTRSPWESPGARLLMTRGTAIFAFGHDRNDSRKLFPASGTVWQEFRHFDRTFTNAIHPSEVTGNRVTELSCPNVSNFVPVLERAEITRYGLNHQILCLIDEPGGFQKPSKNPKSFTAVSCPNCNGVAPRVFKGIGKACCEPTTVLRQHKLCHPADGAKITSQFDASNWPRVTAAIADFEFILFPTVAFRINTLQFLLFHPPRNEKGQPLGFNTLRIFLIVTWSFGEQLTQGQTGWFGTRHHRQADDQSRDSCCKPILHSSFPWSDWSELADPAVPDP